MPQGDGRSRRLLGSRMGLGCLSQAVLLVRGCWAMIAGPAWNPNSDVQELGIGGMTGLESSSIIMAGHQSGGSVHHSPLTKRKIIRPDKSF